jgi:superfamily II DNA/RNA helicase
MLPCLSSDQIFLCGLPTAGVHVVVGTPGRVFDMLRRHYQPYDAILN